MLYRGQSLTEAELRERRKKHNQVEIRRRQRIKNSFNELGQICGKGCVATCVHHLPFVRAWADGT